MKCSPFQSLAVIVLLSSLGCQTERAFTITARPVPAQVKIDGVDRGQTPVSAVVIFGSGKQYHHVDITRAGYRDQVVELTPASAADVVVDLRPMSRRVDFNVLPFPAKISVNGKPITPGLVNNVSAELEFTLDPAGKWTSYRITAERPGFQSFERTITWTDPDPHYTLHLEPMRKELTLSTTPPGARVFLDDEEIGTSPLTYRGSDSKGVPFYIDPQTGEWNSYRVRLVRAGFDPIQQRISWDEGKSDYNIDLKPKAKTISIVTAPSGATVTIDGHEVPRDNNGVSVVPLLFPPVNEKGDLKSYTATVSKKTADSEWEPKTITLGWDDGKAEYSVSLQEIKTTPVMLLTPDPDRRDDGWQIVPKHLSTVAMKDTSEGASKAPPQRLTNLPKGTMIGSLAISPDGSRLVFPIITARGDNDLRSQLTVIRTDGTGGIENFSDGKSLELHPAFTPDGKQIVFSSNRGGRRQSVWTLAANGAPGVTQLTSGETNDLWPWIDPARRLFYQAYVDTRPDPRLFMTELGKTTRTDMTQAGGMHPRVSPDAGPDSGTVLFTAVNEKTGKRDIYRMPTRGGIPENLTNSPDVDEFDPAWSPDGSRIAYVSDRGVDEDHRPNYDLWILDLAHPEQPTQVTTNGSWDDCPVWDTHGTALYFRSNRGGEWAIWKISLK